MDRRRGMMRAVAYDRFIVVVIIVFVVVIILNRLDVVVSMVGLEVTAEEGNEIPMEEEEEGRWPDAAAAAAADNDNNYSAGVTREAPFSLSDIHSKSNYHDRRFKAARLLNSLHSNSYEISVPSLVDDHGEFLSYDVTNNRRILTLRKHRRKRSYHDVSAEWSTSNRSPWQRKEEPETLSPWQRDQQSTEWSPWQRNQDAAQRSPDWQAAENDVPGRWIYYRLRAFGRDFHFNVSLNRRLLSPSFVVEYWNRNGLDKKMDGLRRDCHYTGHIISKESTSNVALSNCDGLFGVFSTGEEEYFVEPLWNDTEDTVALGHYHVVYKRTAIKTQHLQQKYDCSLPEFDLTRHSSDLAAGSSKFANEATENNDGHEKKNLWKRKKRHRTKRSYSQENFVETLVVVDKQMVAYHGLAAIEPYVLTVMNIVAKLYRDASIGNDISIVVTRIIILNEAQRGLEITYHADKSLESFCKWQNIINRKKHENGKEMDVMHHDTAILITRYDICTYRNQPCGTLGLAPVAGMCDPGRSCSIIEDIGIATAFSIAHELGHNFGMQHDGSGNPCGSPGHEPAKLMASQLAKNTDPFTWSSCSRDYITGFLDSGKGKCLENAPKHLNRNDRPLPLPGQMHSGDAQCKYQFGSKSTQCKQEIVDMCRELWCYNPSNHCITNSIPAAEGTPCSNGRLKAGWCYRGACMKISWRPKAVDGQWNQWSAWSSCSRSCGGGVKASERFCINPRPQHGGKYCIGERKRYKSCNTFDCPINSTDFRELQCSKYNDELFRGKYYKWKPFVGGAGLDVKPCALNCVAMGHQFYTERSPKVTDGTRCYPDSLDMCVNGLCKHVGCDKILGSNTPEDKCRVCGGQGNNCRTIKGIFDKHIDVGGESYAEVVRIPRGVMNVLVIEKKISRNYLALKSNGKDAKYYVNGAWTIDWPRKFEVAGTTFLYERPKDKPESLQSLGPTTEDLTIFLLMQEKNLGVMYEYSVQVTDKIGNKTGYMWQYGQWSDCSLTCARGISRLKADCVHKENRQMAVAKDHCHLQPKLSDKMKYCNEDPCPPEWNAGDWSECSRTCDAGWKTRSMSCIQKIDETLNEVVERGNCTTKKPKTKWKCNTEKCPSHWAVDGWSECRPPCGAGIRTRNVYCISSKGEYMKEDDCDKENRPPNREKCHTTACSASIWRTGAWGECSSPCGPGTQMRSVACRTYLDEKSNDCDIRTMPNNIQECEGLCRSIDNSSSEKTECEDDNKAEYCPLVLKFKFCNRPYFRQMCCKTCTNAGL